MQTPFPELRLIPQKLSNKHQETFMLPYANSSINGHETSAIGYEVLNHD
ncbi:MAG: hypothetical protein WA364_30040 [Candidatus Nitrosopolaris sp.]